MPGCGRNQNSSIARLRTAVVGLTIILGTSSAFAQIPTDGLEGLYFPLNQNLPPGAVGYWAGAEGKAQPGFFQPIRIDLPSGGDVTFFDGGPDRPIVGAAPAGFGVAVGHTYRFRIANLPDYPGVELFPSLEVIDRLYPPAELAEQFPVPIVITPEDVELAIQGRLVTKVVYLEQPQLASPRHLANAMPVFVAPPSQNILALADRLGRPMLIVRIGGRLPDVHDAGDAFFGNGGPVVKLNQQPTGDAVERSEPQ